MTVVERLTALTLPLQDLMRQAASHPTPGSIFIIVVILAVMPFTLVVPMTAVCILAGGLLPRAMAPFVILAGLLLNTLLAWSLARTVVGRRLEVWIEGKGGFLSQVHKSAKQGGFKWAIISRHIPAPFIGAPMVLASAGVSLGTVLAGTAVAMTPWAVMYTWAGHAGREGDLKSLGLALTTFVLLVGLGLWMRHHYFKTKKKGNPGRVGAVAKKAKR